MSRLDIEKRDGMVELPNGEMIRSDLAHDEFRSSEIYSNSRTARAADGVTDYQFAAGEFEGKRWRGRLSFFNQLLLYLDLCANLYPKNWKRDERNLDLDLATKDFHERILNQLLGPPDIKDDLEKFRAYELSGRHLKLAQQATWRFPWGTVTSAYSLKDGTTSIRVAYATGPQKTMKKFVGRRKRQL